MAIPGLESNDSRSKVLYSNFNLGGPQPTHLYIYIYIYDFSISLCGVTQGNHAKHKLGARFAQGWRKCFHACVDCQNTLYIYIYLIYCMYIDFIIKVFLGYISCACIIDVRFLQNKEEGAALAFRRGGGTYLGVLVEDDVPRNRAWSAFGIPPSWPSAVA